MQLVLSDVDDVRLGMRNTRRARSLRENTGLAPAQHQLTRNQSLQG